MKKIYLVFLTQIVSLLLFSSLNAQISNYRLSPLDVIRVEVFQETELDKLAKIASDKTVLLPLIGKVEIAGLTTQEAAKKIEDLYRKDYLVSPQVSVFVSEYAPKRVFVFGQVVSQGEVRMPPEEGITLSKAISNAGGFTRIANRTSVTVKRVLPDDSVKIFEVNVKAIMDNHTSRDMPLEDGDTILVPESIF